MSEREWRFYLNDMIVFAEKVLEYTAGYDQEHFESDGKGYDATIRNLELIGEADFVEWINEVDLSADTLYLEGVASSGL